MRTKKEGVQYSDIAIVRGRLYDSGIEAKTLSKEAIETQVETLNADGLWGDIDYDLLPQGWYWVSIEHVKRLEHMARAYQSPEHLLYGNEMLKQHILSAYDAWCDTLRGEEAGNHVIRVRIPRSLGTTMILMADCLSDDQKEAGYRYLERAWTGTWGWTGENLVWRAQGSIFHATLKSDLNFLEEVLGRVSSEVLVLAEPDADGIQGDFSFHQHGNQLYSGGYGMNFMADIARMALLLANTQFAFSKEKVEIISGLILDGSRWMVRKKVFDYGAMGRYKTNLVLKTTRESQKLDFVTRETLGHTQDVYEADIFNLFIDHRVKPINESYCYLIRPGADENNLAGSVALRVLENSNHIQGVRHDDLNVSEIVFYAPGDIVVHSGLRISVNEPCMVMVCEKDHQAEVSVANPEGTALIVEMKLNDLVEVFDLLGGRDGGKSVVKMVGF